MRLHAAQIVEEQHVGGQCRVVPGQAHDLEDRLSGGAHLRLRDGDAIGLGHLETVEHGGTSTVRVEAAAA